MKDIYKADDLRQEVRNDVVLVFGRAQGDDCDMDWHIGYHHLEDGWMIVNNGDYIDGGYGSDYKAEITHWTAKPEVPNEQEDA